jgi:protein subunit release factor A
MPTTSRSMSGEIRTEPGEAVRVTHALTGIAVAHGDMGSQVANRDAAIAELEQRLANRDSSITELAEKLLITEPDDDSARPDDPS